MGELRDMGIRGGQGRPDDDPIWSAEAVVVSQIVLGALLVVALACWAAGVRL